MILAIFLLLFRAEMLAAIPRSPEPRPIFEDVTATVGLGGVESDRVTFANLNGDGFPDAIVGQTKIFFNDHGKRFVRSPSDRELSPEGIRPPSVVQVGDVNNDGVLDLYLGRYTDLSLTGFKDDGLRSEIWLGDKAGRYHKKIDAGVGKYAETTISACFVDADRDGILDLFVGNAYTEYGKSYVAFPDRLYRGSGDGTFKDVTEEAGLLGIEEPGKPNSRRPTYGVAHTDWNNDGLQDLLVASYGRQWNRLWRNNGDGTFSDVAADTGFDGDQDRSGKYPDEVDRKSEEPFRANGNTFDCAVADFDNDGDMDCFLADIAHWWAGSSSDPSALLVNRGRQGHFAFQRGEDRIVRHHAAEHWNQGDLHAGWLDVDNDGYLDLLIASSDYPDAQILRLFHQSPQGSFEEWTDRLGFRWVNASQLSLADYDRDGYTDVLLGTNHMRLTKEQRTSHSLSVGLFRNVMAERLKNRFLNVRLLGQAIGARVLLVTGDRRQIREVYGGQGHAGHRDDTDCRFGVGMVRKADLLIVHWPDAEGTIQRFTNVQTNEFYQLRKGKKLVPVKPERSISK